MKKRSWPVVACVVVFLGCGDSARKSSIDGGQGDSMPSEAAVASGKEGGIGEPDVRPDGPCTREDDAAFCRRFDATCGPLRAEDLCGVVRTVASCGTCDGGSCVGNSCASIRPGAWVGSNVQFSVAADGKSLSSIGSTIPHGAALVLSLNLEATGNCGAVVATKVKESSIPIVDRSFSYSEASYSVAGTFTGPEQASGSYDLTMDTSSCPEAAPHQSGKWTASWARPLALPDGNAVDAAADGEPEAGLLDAAPPGCMCTNVDAPTVEAGGQGAGNAVCPCRD